MPYFNHFWLRWVHLLLPSYPHVRNSCSFLFSSAYAIKAFYHSLKSEWSSSSFFSCSLIKSRYIVSSSSSWYLHFSTLALLKLSLNLLICNLNLDYQPGPNSMFETTISGTQARLRRSTIKSDYSMMICLLLSVNSPS